MARMLCSFVVLTSCFLTLSSQADAQDYRVYTRVFNEGVAAQERTSNGAPVVARSLSIFHSGKVYDYIDRVGEVIIFEPTKNRFIILNTTRSLATVVEFDELKQVLKVAEHETEQYLTQLEAQRSPGAKQARASLTFQLHPKFQEQYNEGQKQLQLSSPFLTYRAKCARVQSPELVESYLRYADWMARLNYALHPHAFFPTPRIALNDSLRRHKVLPVEVELRSQAETSLHLRAQHQIQWSLERKDLSLIHHWETLLKSKNIQHVSFRDYQKSILVGQTRKK